MLEKYSGSLSVVAPSCRKLLMAVVLMPLMALAIDVKVTGIGMEHFIGWGYYIEYTIDGVAYRSDTAPQAMNLIAWRNMSADDQKTTIDAYGWQTGRRMEDFGYAGAQEIADKINEESGWTALWDQFKEKLINRDYQTLAEIFDKDDTRFAYFEENYALHGQGDNESEEMRQLREEQQLLWKWSYESYLAIKTANEKRLQTGVQALSSDLIALIVDKVLVPNITMANPIELGFKYGMRKEVLGAILDYANSITGAGDALLKQVLTERVTCESGAEIVAKLADMVNQNLHLMNLCKRRLIENRSAYESLASQNAAANAKAEQERAAKIAAEKIEERLAEAAASHEPDAVIQAENSRLSAEICELKARPASDREEEESLARQIAQKEEEKAAYNQSRHASLLADYRAWETRFIGAIKAWEAQRPFAEFAFSSIGVLVVDEFYATGFKPGPELDPTVEPEVNGYIAAHRSYIDAYLAWREAGWRLYEKFEDELEPITTDHAALEGVEPLVGNDPEDKISDLMQTIEGSTTIFVHREQELIDRAEANLRAYKQVYQDLDEARKAAEAARTEKRANAELAVVAYLDAKKGMEDCLLNLPAYLDGLEAEPGIFNVPKTSKLWQGIFGGNSKGNAAKMQQYRREVNEIYTRYLIYERKQDIAQKHISYYNEPGLIDDIWNVDVIGVSTSPEAVAKAEMLNEKLVLLKQAVKHFNMFQREGTLMEAYEKLSNNEAYYRDPSNGAFLELYQTISAARSYKDGDGIRRSCGGFAGQVEGFNPNDSDVDIYERLLLPIMDRVRDASNSVTWNYNVVGRISGASGAVFGNLAIPAVLDGYPVVEIGYVAFSGCDDVEEFILPSSVKTISDQAFKRCSSLKRVVIPEGVTEVGAYLFFDCSHLESVAIPTTLKSVPELMFDGFTGQLKTVYTAKGDVNRVKAMLATTGLPLDGIRITDEDPSEDPVNPVDPVDPGPQMDDGQSALYSIAASTPFTGDASYNGWVRGADGAIAGLLTIKAGKAAKPEKGGQSKLSIQYTPFGGKKQTIKLDKSRFPVAGGNPTVSIPGIGMVTFGGTSLAGAGLQVGKDLTKSKDKAEKVAANARLARKDGTWTFAIGTDAGYAAFSVTVKKGKGKLTGTLPDGTKVSVSSQGILGDKALAIPFAYSKKGALGFVFWVNDDGTTSISDLTALKLANGTTLAVKEQVAPSAALKLADGTRTFTVSGLSVTQAFTVAGRKWTLPKHVKKPTEEKPDLNPSDVKLKFTEKTGVVKGTFAILGPTGKALKYTVNGVVVNGALYGAAFVKGGTPVACEAK